MSYDFSDPKIRDMINRDHNPSETFTVNAAGFAQSYGITCTIDHQPWPCPAMRDLREWEEKIERKRQQVMEETRQATTITWPLRD